MIKIEEKTSLKIPGNTSLFLSSEYSETLLKILNQYTPRAWHKGAKEWELPLTYLAQLLLELHEFDTVELKVMSDATLTTTAVKNTRILSYKTKPFNYQLEGIDYGLNHDKWLLLDQCGLGKTLQLIYLAEELHAQKNLQHCLIICGINTLKNNWRKEIEQHSTLDCVIIGEQINSKGTATYMSIKDRIKQLNQKIKEFFIILNIETLRNDDVVAAIEHGSNIIDMVVLDEAHKAKSPQSQQGKNLLKLTHEKYKIAATGTLLLNNPLDAYVPLRWIDQDRSIYSNFKSYYCEFGGMMGKQIVGFKNISILKDQIANCSLRRTKDLLDLPPKTIINEMVDMNDKHQKFYSDVKKGIKDEVDKKTLAVSSLLAMITRLRQAIVCPSILTSSDIESSKIERAADLIDQITSNGDKVVVFSNFKETLYQLRNRLDQTNQLLATGDLKDDEISANIDRFQKDPAITTMLCTISKMGTGITLTAANYAIFLDCSWTAAQNQQAEDRIYRIGSKKPVFIYYLWCPNTLDMRIKQLVEQKAQISDYIIDDKMLDTSAEALKKMLLEDNTY